MAFFIPSIQFFFGLPRALFCFGIHFNAILGSLFSAILWTWPYHVSWFCSITFIIVSSSPIFCLIVTFLILTFLDILEDLLRASISVASNRLLCTWRKIRCTKHLIMNSLFLITLVSSLRTKLHIKPALSQVWILSFSHQFSLWVTLRNLINFDFDISSDMLPVFVGWKPPYKLSVNFIMTS